MLLDIVDLLLEPDAYVCAWRDGELYVELIRAPAATSAAA